MHRALRKNEDPRAALTKSVSTDLDWHHLLVQVAVAPPRLEVEVDPRPEQPEDTCQTNDERCQQHRGGFNHERVHDGAHDEHQEQRDGVAAVDVGLARVLGFADGPAALLVGRDLRITRMDIRVGSGFGQNFCTRRMDMRVGSGMGGGGQNSTEGRSAAI